MSNLDNYKKLKQFWTAKINKLITEWKPLDTTYYLQIKDVWEDELNDKKTVQEVSDYALVVCRIIYNSNTWVGGYFGLNLSQILGKLGVSTNDYIQLIYETIEDCEKDLTDLKTELGNYKSNWDGHSCSSSCSHTDYDTIKAAKDSLQTQVNSLNTEKNNLQTERDHYKAQLDEKADYNKIKEDIIKQIIADSGLDLDKSSSLEQVIAKIKELIQKLDKPDNTERAKLEQEKTQLQTQITKKDKIIADLQKPEEKTMDEIKQKIREQGKKIGVDKQKLEKSLSEAKSYQQLVELEQEIFATKWQESKNSLQKADKVKNGLIWGLVIALIIITLFILREGYRLMKKE